MANWLIRIGVSVEKFMNSMQISMCAWYDSTDINTQYFVDYVFSLLKAYRNHWIQTNGYL